jgi:hypothetical protein
MVRSCPYIGSKEDPSVHYRYPSEENLCYRCRRPAAPAAIHQQRYCLGGAQTGCPVYLQDADQAFPVEILASVAPRAIRINPNGIFFLLASLLIVCTALAYQYSPEFRAWVSDKLLRPLPTQALPLMTAAPMLGATPRATPYAVAGLSCLSAVWTGEPCTPAPPTATLVPSATVVPSARPTVNEAATQACRWYQTKGTPCPPYHGVVSPTTPSPP